MLTAASRERFLRFIISPSVMHPNCSVRGKNSIPYHNTDRALVGALEKLIQSTLQSSYINKREERNEREQVTPSSRELRGA